MPFKRIVSSLDLRKRKCPTEYQECKTFFIWLEMNFKTKGLAYHIPNESKRSYGLARLLQAIGLRKGVSDYCLPLKVGNYGSLYIEMKRSNKNLSKVSKDQLEWVEKMNKSGQKAVITYGAAEAIDIVEKYLNGTLC
jgi:hypothetical protein